MRPVSKELSEICYPFIYEDSPVCDFEITADELCSRIGLVLSMELDDFSRDILTRLQPNVYHLNGSVRGKLAITESEVEELKADYEAIKARIDGGFKGLCCRVAILRLVNCIYAAAKQRKPFEHSSR